MTRPRTRTDVVVRDRAFAHRLKMAVEGVPGIPEFGQGQQTWLRERLGVSAEAIRKWFMGEARPRPAMMRKLASVLEADEAWLSLGIEPTATTKEKRVRNAEVSGAVNVIAGLIEMSGGHPAFPADNDPRKGYVDLYAIIRGAQLSVHVSLGQRTSDNVYRFVIPKEYQDCTVFGVVRIAPLRLHFLQLTQTLLDKHRVRRGGYYEVTISKIDQDYITGSDKWPRISNFSERA